MAGRIDTHFHMIPPFWADALEARVGKPMWGTPDWSPESAINVMDRLGTDVAMISLATPSVMPWDSQDRVDMADRVNEFGADLCVKSGGRLGYFATLPMPDPKATVAAIGRAYDHYKADGFVILSSYHGQYLGHEAFAPVWDELERHKAVVFMHPGIPEMKPLPGVPQPTVDFPMDTTRSALSLVVAGVPARCPSVKIILSHAGGFLPYAARRFALLLHDYTMKDTKQDDIMKAMKTFYFDTALSSPDALPSILAFAEPGHIIFGSDNPYISHDAQALFTDALDGFQGFTKEVLETINRKNAEALFPRLKA